CGAGKRPLRHQTARYKRTGRRPVQPPDQRYVTVCVAARVQNRPTRWRRQESQVAETAPWQALFLTGGTNPILLATQRFGQRPASEIGAVVLLADVAGDDMLQRT